MQFNKLCVGLADKPQSSLSKEEDKDSFIGQQEFVVGYSKAPEQPQSSARPIYHSYAMTRMGREPATIRIAALELAPVRTAPQETTGDDVSDVDI